MEEGEKMWGRENGSVLCRGEGERFGELRDWSCGGGEGKTTRVRKNCVTPLVEGEGQDNAGNCVTGLKERKEEDNAGRKNYVTKS